MSEKKAPKIITFRAKHFWFILATLVQETELIKEMIKKKIKLYYVCYGTTPLDKWTVEMYKQIGIICVQKKQPKDFDDSLHIGTYGDHIIQSKHPKEITKAFEDFFRKNKTPQDTKLVKITEITTKKAEFKLQSIYSPTLAKSTREEIIRECEE